ncbi:MAG: glycerol-3-phosphate acyltransferase [Ruminococcaceae bacterium]|nr:glycerol-3-phosphate acyltransferase [Oscillospiraceae bacterium]
MKIIVCVVIGYLLGSLNPAALISKLKRKSLRENGTGNLGATNTMLVFGKKLGAFVMLFDILKGFLAVSIAMLLAPDIEWLTLASGFSAIVGHCFPFYLKFRGGKGLATFAGAVLAYSPIIFVLLLISGLVIMLIVNHGFILPYYASSVFAVFVCVTCREPISGVLAVSMSALLMIMHFGNLLKAKNGQDIKIRAYIQSKKMKK